MAEYITKEAAAKAICERCRLFNEGICCGWPIDDCRDARAIAAVPAVDVMTKEEWIDRLKAALEKSHGITEELRAYDGGSEAIADE